MNRADTFQMTTAMVNEYMKKFSAYLAIREIQIKTTSRLCHILGRMVIIKNANNKCWQEWGGGKALIYWWE
jgi:hypothetical protein